MTDRDASGGFPDMDPDDVFDFVLDDDQLGAPTPQTTPGASLGPEQTPSDMLVDSSSAAGMHAITGTATMSQVPPRLSGTAATLPMASASATSLPGALSTASLSSLPAMAKSGPPSETEVMAWLATHPLGLEPLFSVEPAALLTAYQQQQQMLWQLQLQQHQQSMQLQALQRLQQHQQNIQNMQQAQQQSLQNFARMPPQMQPSAMPSGLPPASSQTPHGQPMQTPPGGIMVKGQPQPPPNPMMGPYSYGQIPPPPQAAGALPPQPQPQPPHQVPMSAGSAAVGTSSGLAPMGMGQPQGAPGHGAPPYGSLPAFMAGAAQPPPPGMQPASMILVPPSTLPLPMSLPFMPVNPPGAASAGMVPRTPPSTGPVPITAPSPHSASSTGGAGGPVLSASAMDSLHGTSPMAPSVHSVDDVCSPGTTPKEDSIDEMSLAKRSAHSVAEAKRRSNIKNGFQELQQIIPNCQKGDSSGRFSKATILHKAVDYIACLVRERTTLLAEVNKLRQEVQQLRKIIDEYNRLGRPNEIEEKAKLFIVRAQEMEDAPGLYSTENIKFFVFCSVVDRLWESFNAMVLLDDPETFSATLLAWFEQYCGPEALRKTFLTSLQSLGTALFHEDSARKIRRWGGALTACKDLMVTSLDSSRLPGAKALGQTIDTAAGYLGAPESLKQVSSSPPQSVQEMTPPA